MFALFFRALLQEVICCYSFALDAALSVVRVIIFTGYYPDVLPALIYHILFVFI